MDQPERRTKLLNSRQECEIEFTSRRSIRQVIRLPAQANPEIALKGVSARNILRRLEDSGQACIDSMRYQRSRNGRLKSEPERANTDLAASLGV